MIKNLIKNAFENANAQTSSTRPTLFILRGFTEIASHFPIPKDWELLNIFDLEGNETRYILAESFQLMLLDYKLYALAQEELEENPKLAENNIVSNDTLIADMFGIALELEQTSQSIARNTYLLDELVEKRFQVKFIDFNLYDTKDHISIYFPINYEPLLAEDYDFFDGQEYEGFFNPAYHGQGIIQYYQIPMAQETDAIKVFDDTYANEYLDIKLNPDEDYHFYETLSEAFFIYLNKMNELS